MSRDEDTFSECDPNSINLSHETDPGHLTSTSEAFIERLPQALSYAANLDVGDHAILFYDNLVVAAEYFCAYIEEGIKRRETTYVTGLPRDRYEKLFIQLGIKVAVLENCGYLRHIEIRNTPEHRQPIESRLRRTIESLLRANLETEYRGKRFIILHQWPQDHTCAQELVEFEKWLSTIPHPASVICCYDARGVIDEANSNFFTRLLKVHGHCLFQGIGMPTNILLGDRLSPYPKLEAGRPR